MSYQIFISYRRNGGEALGFLLKEKLQQAGYSVFFDVESLHSGKFNDELFEVIDECNIVLLVLSPGVFDRCSDPNDWVYKEISYALQHQKKIIPIMTKGFEWPSNLPEAIKDVPLFHGLTVNYVFFESFINKLHHLINNVLNSTFIEKNSAKKQVLLWGDFETNISKRIIKKLSLPDKYSPQILSDPIEILSKNLSLVDCIILINTDVTKLANDNFALERINQALEKYVLDGGKLIATHDIIYRRTRNVTLQNMFGCCISSFKRVKEIQYNKTDACAEHNVFNELPTQFTLIDDELCWGENSPDTIVYFKTENNIPLVFSREYGSGICIWMNSGDFQKYPAESLLHPDKNFISMLKDLILLEEW